MSSRDLKTSKFSYVLMKILTFSTHSMKYIWYSIKKSKYPLCIFSLVTDTIYIFTVAKQDFLDNYGTGTFFKRFYMKDVC